MIEIEHKFLLKNEGWRDSASEGVRYRQGYITTESGTTVRVRIAGQAGFLTLKGELSGEAGISRSEFEYEIPLTDAEAMMEEYVDSPVIDKLRYLITHGGKVWEIDEFSGDNTGLIVAEVELKSENELFELPSWAGDCVSDERRYTNSSLAKFPFKNWED